MKPLSADAAAVTPARRLELPRSEGCRMLPGPHGGWLDGGEQRIAAIVRGAADLSSTSDELAAHRDDWIERYHLSRERANVVRCLDIPDDCAVLEIGAGCGAVTRYLGEVAGAVDALEPTPERAAVARARTHDLASVELFVGELDSAAGRAGVRPGRDHRRARVRRRRGGPRAAHGVPARGSGAPEAGRRRGLRDREPARREVPGRSARGPRRRPVRGDRGLSAPRSVPDVLTARARAHGRRGGAEPGRLPRVPRLQAAAADLLRRAAGRRCGAAGVARRALSQPR